MAIPSQWPGTCKDCGATHAVGDMIDKNGKSSPNKDGLIKDHWCKNGKNCQGAQKVDGSVILDNPATLENRPPSNITDPTPEQFLELGIKMLEGGSEEDKQFAVERLTKEIRGRISKVLIQRSVIEQVMHDLGLQHPGRRGFVEDVLR